VRPVSSSWTCAAFRHFFDGLVTRHAILLNPALSVHGERYEVVEGKTPEITVAGARTLLTSIDASHLVGLRDRAIVAILIYTAARAGAVAGLHRGGTFVNRTAGRQQGRAMHLHTLLAAGDNDIAQRY
jgi:integrase/recombinase XerD